MPIRASILIRRRALRPQIVERTQLVPLAAARQVLDEASHWLGVTLPSRYAAGLAYRAQITYAHSPSFRRALHRPGDASRERLYVYLRHWLAARLQRERFALYVRLAVEYRTGQTLDESAAPQILPASPSDATLSPEVRQLLGF